jgi:hypothetical protein
MSFGAPNDPFGREGMKFKPQASMQLPMQPSPNFTNMQGLVVPNPHYSEQMNRYNQSMQNVFDSNQQNAAYKMHMMKHKPMQKESHEKIHRGMMLPPRM